MEIKITLNSTGLGWAGVGRAPFVFSDIYFFFPINEKTTHIIENNWENWKGKKEIF